MNVRTVEELHFELLRLIESNPQVTQRHLAEALGVSLGRVNYCLRELRDKGWVKARNFRNSSNKRVYMYVLSPSGIEARARATVCFLRAKLAERDRILAEIEQLLTEVEATNTRDE